MRPLRNRISRMATGAFSGDVPGTGEQSRTDFPAVQTAGFFHRPAFPVPGAVKELPPDPETWKNEGRHQA